MKLFIGRELTSFFFRRLRRSLFDTCLTTVKIRYLLFSFILVLTVAGNALAQLPPGWSGQDIGVQGTAGAVFEENGQWIVIGSGSETWYRSDVFYYVHKTMLGDCEITARMNAIPSSIEATPPEAFMPTRSPTTSLIKPIV